MNPINDKFRVRAMQLQEELMNEVDDAANKLASSMNVQIFQFSKQTKIDLIQRVYQGVVNGRTYKGQQDELDQIRWETKEKLNSFVQGMSGGFFKVQSGETEMYHLPQADYYKRESPERWCPPSQKKRQRSLSREPTFQRPTVKSNNQVSEVVMANSDMEQISTEEQVQCKVLQCPVCPRQFYSMVSIVKHMLINHWNQEERSSCPYCEMVDKSSDVIAKHMMDYHFNQSGFTGLKDLISKMDLNEQDDEDEIQYSQELQDMSIEDHDSN